MGLKWVWKTRTFLVISWATLGDEKTTPSDVFPENEGWAGNVCEILWLWKKDELRLQLWKRMDSFFLCSC